MGNVRRNSVSSGGAKERNKKNSQFQDAGKSNVRSGQIIFSDPTRHCHVWLLSIVAPRLADALPNRRSKLQNFYGTQITRQNCFVLEGVFVTAETRLLDVLVETEIQFTRLEDS